MLYCATSTLGCVPRIRWKSARSFPLLKLNSESNAMLKWGNPGNLEAASLLRPLKGLKIATRTLVISGSRRLPELTQLQDPVFL